MSTPHTIAEFTGLTALLIDPAKGGVAAAAGAHGVDGGLHFLALLLLSAAGALALLAAATVTFRRRRSRPYLLLVGALAALLFRPISAMGLLVDVASDEQHHLLEHVLDVCIAACLLAAIHTVPAPGDESTYDEPTRRI